MSKLVIIPNNIENIHNILNKDIDGIILSIKDLSTNSPFYITVDELKKILPKVGNKKIYISLNKNIFNKDLELLQNTLVELNSLPISKVLFYDLAIPSICNRLKLNLDLVVYQDHLNNSIYSNLFYKKRNINNTFISSDITYSEILAIKEKKNINIFMLVYGYQSISYSKRNLVSNYLEYIKSNTKDNYYYLKDKEDYYLVKEEDGTTIYTKDRINLINEMDKIKDIDNYVISGLNLNNDELLEIIDNFNNGIITKDDNYIGFFDTKTIYKVKNNG